MKNYIALTVIAVLTFTSCSKSEPMPADDNAKIVGTWHETSFLTNDGYFADVKDGRTYVFNKDMTFVYDDGYIKEHGQFSTESAAQIIYLVMNKGKKRTIAVTYTDPNHAIFKSNGTTSKYEMR